MLWLIREHSSMELAGHPYANIRLVVLFCKGENPHLFKAYVLWRKNDDHSPRGSTMHKNKGLLIRNLQRNIASMYCFTISLYVPPPITTAAARSTKKLSFDLSIHCNGEVLIKIVIHLFGNEIMEDNDGIIIRAIRCGVRGLGHFGVCLFESTMLCGTTHLAD